MFKLRYSFFPIILLHTFAQSLLSRFTIIKMRTSTTLVTAALALTAAAHPHHELSARQISEHQSISKRCAPAAGAFTMERKKRSLAKRNAIMRRDSNVTIHTEGPHYSTIQNDTCVLVPETTAGPYLWPNSDILRQDMREDQPGVPLYLDIGVLDTNSCEPAPNVLIDMWHCKSLCSQPPSAPESDPEQAMPPAATPPSTRTPPTPPSASFSSNST